MTLSTADCTVVLPGTLYQQQHPTIAPSGEKAEKISNEKQKDAEEEKEEEEEELCAICQDPLPDVGRGIIACVSGIGVMGRARTLLIRSSGLVWSFCDAVYVGDFAYVISNV